MTARVAVIGCGWWSTYAHLPALAKHPDATIAGLVDPDQTRLAATADAFDVDATFRSAGELFAAVEVDAVIIAVPHALHHPLAALSLERGVHTLLEKPMVIEPDHGRQLIATARASGAELLIDYPWHYNPHVLALRHEIARGRIGAIEHVSCLYASTVRELYRGNPEPYRDVFGYPVNAPGTSTYSDPELSGGGQGQTQVTHAVALLHWLTGLKPHAVAAFCANFELDVDLADSVAITYEGGAVGVMTSTGSVLPAYDEIVRVELFGRDGHILIDVNQGAAAIYAGGDTVHLESLPAERRNPEDAPVNNLVKIALGHGTNGSPAEVGLRAVEFVSAMYRSAADRRVVELSELYPRI